MMGKNWDQVIEWDRRYFMHNLFAAEEWVPFPVTKVEGCYIFDNKGNRFLDFSSQLWCVNLGQRHPKVVEDVKKALDEFGHLWEFFLTSYRAEAAKLIVEDILGQDGWAGRVRFTSTGSEAVEEALIIAKLYTNRPNIFCREYSYHGWTSGCASCTGFQRLRSTLSSSKGGEVRSVPGFPSGGFFTAPACYCYRCSLGYEYPDCKVDGKLGCVKVTENMIKAVGPRTVAGIITEVLYGTGTIGGVPREYITQIRRLTRDLGILWVDDEVQVGFGRTGKWFAYQHWLPEVKPDVMVVGKGLSSAQLPAAGVVVSKDTAKFFDEYRWWHISTHGSHPVCMAAVVSNIKVMMEERIPDRAAKMGEHLGKRLKELEDRHKCVGHVDGMGLAWYIELVRDRKTKEPFVPEDRYAPYVGDTSKYPGIMVLRRCLEKGVFIGSSVPNSLKVGPPLTITEEDVDMGVEALDYALMEIDEMCS